VASSTLLKQSGQKIRSLGSYVALQIGYQGLGFVCGLLMVNFLSKRDLALATVAMSMQGAMHVLCDVGVTIAVTSIGGRVYLDRHRFGSLIATALRMRWRLAMVVVPVVVPLLVVLLRQTGADWTEVAAITAIILVSVGCELQNLILVQVLLLRSEVRRSQLINVINTLLRLGALIAFLATHSLAVLTALLAGCLAVMTNNWQLNREARKQVDLAAPEDPLDRSEMLRLMRMQAPNAVFYCVQGQLALWLLGFLGNHNEVADYGALGRFAVLIAFLSALMSNILVPGFARLQDPKDLRSRYAEILGGLVGLAILIIAIAWLVPGPLLWILGEKYRHLTHELPLMVGNLMLSFMVGAVWTLNAARTWISITSTLNIPLTLASQAVLALSLDLSTIHGALLFSIGCQLPNAVLCAADSWLGFRRMRRGEELATPALAAPPVPESGSA
jgi:O-antigen/teichoic acid export membrane protein